MVKKIGVAISLALIAFLLFAMTIPGTFEVHRSASIHAPPEKIFPLLDDFHQWTSWSPWETMDSTMTRTHSGAPAGIGAVYSWSGNRKVGTGRMEITGEVPVSKVSIALDFLAPFEAHHTADFTLAPAGDSTIVTWTMRGQNNYVGKLMSIFVSMDQMVGKDFEAGLTNLKAVAEQ
jgi:carbon monoxide dehydrogenase subunit G